MNASTCKRCQLTDSSDSYSQHEQQQQQQPMPIADSEEVFRLFLGGGKFAPIIGELSVLLPAQPPAASTVDALQQQLESHRAHTELTTVKSNAASEARARQLAEHLLEKLNVYVSGDVAAFERAAWQEALLLREEASHIESYPLSC
jgi:hypothetical protein